MNNILLQISVHRLFFNCFPPKNRPSWGPMSSDPSRPRNKSHADSAMIDRLLCSLVDELDQTKLGIHLLDVV
jgi:hypothetical protein